MGWTQLVESGLRFHLTEEEILSLRPFYDRADRELLAQAAKNFLGEFPQAEIEARYPDALDQARFGLLCVLVARPLLECHYQGHGYSESMLDDISADTGAWVRTLKRDLHGDCGLPLKNLDWTRSCFRGNVLQFGRLQCSLNDLFRPKYSLYREKTGLKVLSFGEKGNPASPALSWQDKCINLHIPALGPLKRHACIDSIRRMTLFFAEFLPDYDYRAVVCCSWLLDPVLRGLLAPTSNILAFQSLGHNWRWEEMDQTRNVLWRIWGDAGTEAGLGHIDRLEQKNSLQKSVASYLKTGGRFTEGVLIIFRDELSTLFRELEQTGCVQGISIYSSIN